MKLLKLTSPPYESILPNGARTMKIEEVFINFEYIIHIKPYKNGSDVAMQGALVNHFYDDRTPDELACYINSL